MDSRQPLIRDSMRLSVAVSWLIVAAATHEWRTLTRHRDHGGCLAFVKYGFELVAVARVPRYGLPIARVPVERRGPRSILALLVRGNKSEGRSILRRSPDFRPAGKSDINLRLRSRYRASRPAGVPLVRGSRRCRLILRQCHSILLISTGRVLSRSPSSRPSILNAQRSVPVIGIQPIAPDAPHDPIVELVTIHKQENNRARITACEKSLNKI